MLPSIIIKRGIVVKNKYGIVVKNRYGEVLFTENDPNVICFIIELSEKASNREVMRFFSERFIDQELNILVAQNGNINGLESMIKVFRGVELLGENFKFKAVLDLLKESSPEIIPVMYKHYFAIVQYFVSADRAQFLDKLFKDFLINNM
jgi:hypothetical protein